MAKDTGVVNIHGKEYFTVAKRVNDFIEKHKHLYTLESEIVSIDDSTVVMKAFIRDLTKDGMPVVAVGHAEEDRKASTINKTSALENCETSAYGRALAAFGFAGTEFASADEVAQAISKQNEPSKKWKPDSKKPASDQQRQFISNLLMQHGHNGEEQKTYLIEEYGLDFAEDGGLTMSQADAQMIIDDLDTRGKS